MTSMAQVANRVADAIEKVGQPAILVRLPGKNGTRRELSLKAVPTFIAPNEPTGGVVQTRVDIRISNRELAASDWPVPIRRGDQIIIDNVTYTIQGVQTAAPGGFPAEHLLQAMGMA
jgi:hypothetical protein